MKNARASGCDPVSSQQPALTYESRARDPSGPRKLWVFAVLGIYLLLASSFLTSPLWAGVLLDLDSHIIILAPLVTVLTLCGLALLIVPVRNRRHRPFARRSIVIPIVAS